MLVAVAALVTSACGPSQVKPTPVRSAPTPATPVGTPVSETVVRWFVGLGLGNDANQVTAEEAFVKAYNASQNKVYVSLEIVPTDTAYETLKAEIANGNAPDIVGPVGVRSRNGTRRFRPRTARTPKQSAPVAARCSWPTWICSSR